MEAHDFSSSEEAILLLKEIDDFCVKISVALCSEHVSIIKEELTRAMSFMHVESCRFDTQEECRVYCESVVFEECDPFDRDDILKRDEHEIALYALRDLQHEIVDFLIKRMGWGD